MSNRIPTVNAPRSVAYFNAYVPVRSCDSEERAKEIVARYLYGGFMTYAVEWPATEMMDPEAYFRVGIRYVDHWGENRVQYQRDRLSSGMYLTSEPVVFEPVKEA